MKKLKPCPFCGSKAEIREDGDFLKVQCMGVGCYASMRCISKNKELVIAKWNERVG